MIRIYKISNNSNHRKANKILPNFKILALFENNKFCKAIFSVFYNISQPDFAKLLILRCSFKLWCTILFILPRLTFILSYKLKNLTLRVVLKDCMKE